MKRTLLVVAAAAVAGAGIAIAVASGPDPAAAPEIELRPVGSSRDIVLPLDRYQQKPDDLGTIDHAAAVLARQCVRGFGQEWPLPAVPQPAPAGSGSGRYGVMDADEVARLGYHAPDETRPERKAPPGTPEATMIFTGKGMTSFGGKPVPDGGCIGQAHRELDRGVPAAISGADVVRIDQTSFEAAQQDERVRRAMGSWRECMAAAGYHYTDVWAANNDVRWGSAEPAQVEIDTARTDVACRQRTRLVETWLAVETAHQNRAISARAAEFDALERGMRIRLDNARAVLAAG